MASPIDGSSGPTFSCQDGEPCPASAGPPSDISATDDQTVVQTVGPHSNPLVTYLSMGATFLEFAAFVTTYSTYISGNGYSTQPYTTIYYMALWDALLSMYGIG